MTTNRRARASFVLLAQGLLGASVLGLGIGRAGGQQQPAPDPCTGSITDQVDFSKPPNEIEGQNKLVVAIQPVKTDKGLTIEVSGVAYYPDGVLLNIAIRHRKLRTHFEEKRVAVKDHVFGGTLGPFAKPIPPGGLVVEAIFILGLQPPQIAKKLKDDNYMHCNPPCKHDSGNLRAASYSLGTTQEEQAAEKAEKEVIAEARKGLFDAYKACGELIGKIESKQTEPSGATADLDRLDKDLEAVSAAYNAWRTGRQFQLFSDRTVQLKNLKASIRSALRSRAVLAGVTLADVPAGKAADMRASAEKDLTRIGDDLKGFLDEADSLSKAYQAGESKPTLPSAASPDKQSGAPSK